MYLVIIIIVQHLTRCVSVIIMANHNLDNVLSLLSQEPFALSAVSSPFL